MPEPETPPTLRTETPPAPLPAPESPRYITCDFCKCKVTRTSGEVVTVSEEARTYRDAGETHRKEIAKLNERVSELQSQITAKDTEIATLKGTPSNRRAFL